MIIKVSKVRSMWMRMSHWKWSIDDDVYHNGKIRYSVLILSKAKGCFPGDVE